MFAVVVGDIVGTRVFHFIVNALPYEADDDDDDALIFSAAYSNPFGIRRNNTLVQAFLA